MTYGLINLLKEFRKKSNFTSFPRPLVFIHEVNLAKPFAKLKSLADSHFLHCIIFSVLYRAYTNSNHLPDNLLAQVFKHLLYED